MMNDVESVAPSDDDLERRAVETLISLREERGWSQSELARKMVDAGWTTYNQMTVSRTEKGDRPIRLNEIAALADIFEVDMYSLWLPRSVRGYAVAMKEVEKLSEELYALTRQYLRAQFRLACAADVADLAEEELSYAANQLLITPERLARQARANEESSSEAVTALVAEPANDQESKAEAAFWDSEKRKLRELYRSINGKRPEEA